MGDSRFGRAIQFGGPESTKGQAVKKAAEEAPTPLSRKYNKDTWTWGRTSGPSTKGYQIRAFVLKELMEMRKFYNFINKEKKITIYPKIEIQMFMFIIY